jgi:hypothetical protein
MLISRYNNHKPYLRKGILGPMSTASSIQQHLQFNNTSSSTTPPVQQHLQFNNTSSSTTPQRA